jgi:hypothetical protein
LYLYSSFLGISLWNFHLENLLPVLYACSRMKYALPCFMAAALALLGAGCANPFAKTTPDTPETPVAAQKTNAADPDEPGQDAVMPIERDNWGTYRSEYGFSFRYPLPPDASEAWDGTGRLSIALPNRSLDAAWLKADAARQGRGAEPEPCERAGTNPREDTAYVNGIRFDVCLADDTAAGQAFHTFRYTTRRNGKIAVLTFEAQTLPDPANDERCKDGSVRDRSCTEFNPYSDAGTFLEIIKTFEWPDPDFITMRDEEIFKERNGMEVSIRYPLIVDASFADAWNAKMREDMRELADRFTAFSRGLPSEESLSPFTLTLEPAHVYESDGLINILFEGSEYTGGAHPTPIYESYIFNGDDREFISLLDYFERRDVTLEDVVKTARKTLGEHPYLAEDEDWIRRGTEPKEENYRYASIEDDTVTILIPPYQVGPYAVGPQEVKIEL